MANIVIGYQNKCLDSGVTFTPSSEDTDFDADNLGIAHPSEFWRIADLSSEVTLDIAFPVPFAADLIVPLYVTAAPHQNAVPRTNDYTAYSAGTVDEGWTYTNATKEVSTVATDDVEIPIYTLTSDATSGAHDITRQVTKNASQTKWKLSIYTLASANRLPLGLEANSGANYARCTVNPSTCAINSSSDNGTFTVNATNSEVVSGSLYRITMDFTSGSEADVTVRVLSLDASYNITHTTAGTPATTSTTFGGVMLRSVQPALPQDSADNQGAETVAWASSNDSACGYWSYSVDESAPYGSTSFHPLCGSRDATIHFNAHGWSHAVKRVPLGGSTPLDFYNEIHFAFNDYQNSTTWNGATDALDISAIYVGPTWQPTVNLADDWTIRPAAGSPSVGRAYGNQEYRPQIAEPRELTLRLGYESPDDAYREAMAMGAKVGQHSPILVIIDPDEYDYAQEQMIYGTLTDLRIGHMGWFSDRGDGTAGSRYEISMTVRELLP
jgi:hypothetical protein